MTTAVRSYQELVGWQKGIQLVTEVYHVTQKFTKEEIYGLDQLDTAGGYIDTQQHRGRPRSSLARRIQTISRPCLRSCFELESQILIARNLSYISQEEAQCLLRR